MSKSSARTSRRPVVRKARERPVADVVVAATAGGETRERILRAAAQAWHANSFDGVGIAEICRLAKIHKGSFFHFFASKEDVLLAVLDRYAQQIGTGMRNGPFRRDVPPLDRFRRFLQGMRDGVRAQRASGGCFSGCPIGNIIIELSTRNDAVRLAASRVFDVMQAVFAEAIDDAVLTGALPPGTNSATVAASVLAFMQGLAVLGKAYGDAERLEAVSAQLMQLFVVPPSTTPVRTKRVPRRGH